MQGLEHIQETTLSDNGLYDVIEGVPTEVSEDEVVRLEGELATERERSLRLLVEFDNYRRRTNEERAFAEEAGKTRDPSCTSRRNGRLRPRPLTCRDSTRCRSGRFQVDSTTIKRRAALEWCHTI
jgi:hypothetical protein